ncbi:sulfate ABC transporter permease subunit CysT [soil metagenome]
MVRSRGVLWAAWCYLLLAVGLPLAALAREASKLGLAGIWREAARPEAVSALGLTFGASLLAAFVNAGLGTWLAWSLERKPPPFARALDALIDLPLALPSIVTGTLMLAVFGPLGWFKGRVPVLFERPAVLLVLLFVTLPLVVRAVQPVIEALGHEEEAAAATLGASSGETFRRVVWPALRPAVVGGAALAFARGMGEFGAMLLVTGNVPFKTEVASAYVYGRIESGEPGAAAGVACVLLLLSAGTLLFADRRRRREA